MKKNQSIIFLFCLPIILISFGCKSLRFAPDESQKENAYIHVRATQLSADLAKNENSSQKLKELTSLSAKQSKAFLAYYGLPDQLPETNTAEDILSESNIQICNAALENATQRPDGWEVANNALDIGIAIAGIFGGACGIKIAAFLQSAKKHSNALNEIVNGNEIFMNKHPEKTKEFKAAQSNQSPQTKTLVTEIKKSTTKT